MQPLVAFLRWGTSSKTSLRRGTQVAVSWRMSASRISPCGGT